MGLSPVGHEPNLGYLSGHDRQLFNMGYPDWLPKLLREGGVLPELHGQVAKVPLDDAPLVRVVARVRRSAMPDSAGEMRRM